MKLTVEQQALNRALSQCAGVVIRKTDVPILKSVRVSVTGSRIKVAATNLDCAIEAEAIADVEREGSVCVDARTFLDAVKRIPKDWPIDLWYEEEDQAPRLHIRSGSAVFELPTMPADQYPDLMSVGDVSTIFDIEAADIKNLFDRVKHAASNEDTRYYLCGVYLHVGDVDDVSKNKLIAVATDGHRLARRWMDLPEGVDAIPPMIVPVVVVGHILSLAGDGDQLLTLTVSDTKIALTSPGVTYVAKLIDGKYPDYHRVIPETSDNVITVDRKAFEIAVDQASVVKNKTHSGVMLNGDATCLSLSMKNPETGTSDIEINASATSDGITIGMNHVYLADMARAIEGEEICLHIQDAGSPMLVQSADSGSRGDYTLMPMRV